MSKLNNSAEERMIMIMLLTILVIIWEGYFVLKYIIFIDNFLLWIPLFFTIAIFTSMFGYWLEKKINQRK